jgi:hypothetical protein
LIGVIIGAIVMRIYVSFKYGIDGDM